MQSTAETGGDHTAETTNKKKKSVLKKIKKKSDVNMEEQEDLGIFVQKRCLLLLQDPASLSLTHSLFDFGQIKRAFSLFLALTKMFKR